MAIKVIKHGTKVFRVICPICGCEFEYELGDLIKEVDKESITYGAKVKVVKCPECGEKIKHSEYRESYPTWPTYPSPIQPSPQIPWTPNQPSTVPQWPWVYPDIIYCSDWASNLDCDKCPNKPNPAHPVVGDTPCTWCRKNQPYCYAGDKFPEGYKGGSIYSTCNLDTKNYNTCVHGGVKVK